MKQHKWYKEIISYLNGEKVYGRMNTHKSIIAEGEVKKLSEFDLDNYSFYIKPQSFEPDIMEMAARALAIPEISEAVDRLLEAFEKPKEPQDLASKSYLYVYFGNKYSIGHHHFVSTAHPKGMKEFEYLGKIPLIVESNDD